MATEETLVLVKPDGVARGLTGAILARIEAKGYALVDIRLVEPDRDTLEQHYAEHEGKPFYEPLLEFMQSGPVVGSVVPPGAAEPRARLGLDRVGRARARPLVRLIGWRVGRVARSARFRASGTGSAGR